MATSFAYPGLFLFIFVLFKHNITEKTVYFSGIPPWIVRLEDEHADHLTTTTARMVTSLFDDCAKSSYSSPDCNYSTTFKVNFGTYLNR